MAFQWPRPGLEFQVIKKVWPIELLAGVGTSICDTSGGKINPAEEHANCITINVDDRALFIYLSLQRRDVETWEDQQSGAETRGVTNEVIISLCHCVYSAKLAAICWGGAFNFPRVICGVAIFLKTQENNLINSAN